MPTTEELAQSCQHQLQWVKTFQGAGIPTTAQGLLLRFTDGGEFKLMVLRTKRPKKYYNYSDKCWVNRRDKQAVEERFCILEHADENYIPPLLQRVA
jgi:hypothetical protein